MASDDLNEIRMRSARANARRIQQELSRVQKTITTTNSEVRSSMALIKDAGTAQMAQAVMLVVHKVSDSEDKGDRVIFGKLLSNLHKWSQMGLAQLVHRRLIFRLTFPDFHARSPYSCRSAKTHH